MNIFELKKDIRNKTVGQFYTFCGLEREGMRIYWSEIASRTDREVLMIDSIREVITYKQSLLEKPKVFVCYNDRDFMTNETAWDKVLQALGKNLLILTVDSIDKRSKFAKRFDDSIVPFDYFTREVLTYHIQKQIDLSESGCSALIQACNGSYGRILLELDKVTAIKQALPDWSYDDIVDEMLYRGVIHEDVGDLLFTLGNAIISKDIETAYTCTRDGDIPPLKLIQVLYNGIKRLLLVQRCKELGYKDADITKETGISSKEIWGISHNVNTRTSENLIQCLQTLRKCEKAIKEGVLCEENVLDYLLITLI